MKKRIAAIFMAMVTTTGLLAGCGGKSLEEQEV